MTETIDVLRTFCDVEKVTDVLVTNDYHLFGFINGNRELNQTNLNNIKESLKTKQILESAIIVGLDIKSEDKKPFKIIEGQHRFTACSELNLPVSFIIRKDFDINVLDKSLSDVELLNTASKTWDIGCFMTSKALLGLEPYVLYQKLFSKYRLLEHETILIVVNKYRGNSRYVWFQQFKEGLLVLDNEIYDKVDKDLKTLYRMLPSVQDYGKRHYIKALTNIMYTPEIDIERLIHRISTFKGTLPFSKTVEKCYEIIVRDVYNKGLSKNKLVYQLGDTEVSFVIKP
jgi:hypothetical protein